jgi:hypothetical protein
MRGLTAHFCFLPFCYFNFMSLVEAALLFLFLVLIAHIKASEIERVIEQIIQCVFEGAGEKLSLQVHCEKA